MSIDQRTVEAWWASPRPNPQSQPQALYSSPLWGTQPHGPQSVRSYASYSHKSISSASTSIDGDSTGDSTRALQLRYNDILQQLKQCRELEASLVEQQQRIVSSLFMSNKDYGPTKPPISPPLQQQSQPEPDLDDRDPPPTREQMIARLVEGQRENYRRIFVPGRGWVSKTNLQIELQISENELDHMAKL